MISKAAEREANLKRKKTERRRQKRGVKHEASHFPSSGNGEGILPLDLEDEFEIEYVPEPIAADYESVLAKFVSSTAVDNLHSPADDQYSSVIADILDADVERKAAEAAASAILADSVKLSNKEKRLNERISLAALKASVERPDLVDGMDNCGSDPHLLLLLKGYKNVVQVPRHWSNKRNYLANKRGIDKGAFKLPEYIEQTGIAKIRQALIAKEAEKDIKAKQRSKMRPKTGKLDIDYQVLYKAFFKYQTKPAFLTKFGDIYYEGREAETKYVHKRPGLISPLLREALGMIEGSPVPWLVNMQRFGPPPSYPYLKIPGLNSPIPIGAEWGYHPGGWGKPPVDEYGTPIYGGMWKPDTDRAAIVDLGNLQARKDLWGEFAEESSDDEDEQVSDVVPVPAVQPVPAPQQFSQGVAVSLAPPSIPNIPQFPVVNDLQELYRVLPQKSAPTQPGALFPSRTVYDVSPDTDIATAIGIAQRASEVENEDVITADMIKQQLAEHEAAAARVEQKKPKKKQKFKF